MRDFIKRVAIGVAVGLSLFFIKAKCFALSLDGDVSGSVQILSSTNTRAVTIGSNSFAGVSVGGINIDIIDFYSSTNDYIIIPFNSVVYFGNTSLTSSSTFDGGVSDFIFRANLNSSDSSANAFCEVQNNYIVCPLVHNKTYVSLSLAYSKFYIDSNDEVVWTFTILAYAKYLSFTSFSSSVVSSINDQTDDILDSDSPSSSTYDNDYSSDDYDDAQESINSQLDVDVSTLLFDPSQWAQSFSYIWSLVTSFLQINSKVFATVTGFLTLSFVGLVIGRS